MGRLAMFFARIECSPRPASANHALKTSIHFSVDEDNPLPRQAKARGNEMMIPAVAKLSGCRGSATVMLK